jgi:Flp pilus assembly protein TadG
VNERGLAESTQWAVVVPVLLALVLGLVQVGIWLHGRSVAGQAAAAAADRLAGQGSLVEAETVARGVADRGGLQQLAVATSTVGELVTVTVSGRMPVFFDVGQSWVSESAVLPRERVRRP